MKRIKVIISDESESLATIIRAEDKATVENVLDHVLDFGQEKSVPVSPLADIDKFFDVQIYDSDAIKRVGYNFYSRVLFIKFAGGNSFTYDDVPEELFFSLIEADSKGQFYNQFIKGQY